MSQNEYLQLYIHDSRSLECEYSLRVPSILTVGQLKKMAAMHFRNSNIATHVHQNVGASRTAQFPTSAYKYTIGMSENGVTVGSAVTKNAIKTSDGIRHPTTIPAESVFSASVAAGSSVTQAATSGDFGASCQLLMVNPVRQLDESLSLTQEKLADQATLLLLHRIQQPLLPPSELAALEEIRAMASSCGRAPRPLADGAAPTLADVLDVTVGLPHSTLPPRPLNKRTAVDKIENMVLQRMICMGVAHWSLRQQGSPSATQQAFASILRKLEARHKSGINTASIKKLQDMGFSEPASIMALKMKNSNEQDATEWLLTCNPERWLPPLPPDLSRELTLEDDPVEVLMPRFWQYRRSYFTVNQSLYDDLVCRGYDSTRVFDALVLSDNNDVISHRLLSAPVTPERDPIYTPPPLTHPIMEGLHTSSIVQVSLGKPKVLYALLALFENPTNFKVWLSDADTSSVVNVILKVHHEERHNEKCPADVIVW